MYGLKYGPRDFYIWIDKGGTGKTTIALALYFKLKEMNVPYCIVTNQTTSLLSKVLNKDQDLFITKPKFSFSNINFPKIIDLEGHSKDSFISDVVANCKHIIVPVLATFAEMQASISSILAIKELNPKTCFTIVVNKVNKESEFIEIRKTLLKNLNFLNENSFFRLPFSKSLENMFIEKQSIKKMMEETVLKRYHFKKVEASIALLCNHLIANFN